MKTMATLTRLMTLGALAVTVMGVHACDKVRGAEVDAPFEVLATYPHDTGAYTQGLLWDDSVMLESTGQYTHSNIRRVDLTTGRVLQSRQLADNRFGEGLIKLNGKLYQLTWESGVGYVYDAATFAPIDSFTYKGEGWGLATDGTAIIMSDGSDSLRWLDPQTLQQQKAVKVTYEGSPFPKINEMEWVDGMILANVYETDWIAKIDPATGKVVKLFDFASLWPKAQRPYGAEVFNGISLGPQPGTLLVTGKLWPSLYVVRLKE
jgi:glutaminyl-peptide cyclotransferase